MRILALPALMRTSRCRKSYVALAGSRSRRVALAGSRSRVVLPPPTHTLPTVMLYNSSTKVVHYYYYYL